MVEGTPQLSRLEKIAMAVGRLANENDRGKRAQWLYLRTLTKAIVATAARYRTYVEGIDWMVDFQPDRGVVQAANHRSFFDQYVAMLAYHTVGIPWARRMYFPVRSNFFYESPLGLLVNLGIGAGVEGLPDGAATIGVALGVGALAYGVSIALYIGGVCSMVPVKRRSTLSTWSRVTATLRRAVTSPSVSPVVVVTPSRISAS